MDPDEIPEVGTVIDGYRFKGGDPGQQSSWEPVEAAGRQYLPRGRSSGDLRSERAYYAQFKKADDTAVNSARSALEGARRAEGLIARQEQQGQGTGGIYGAPVIGDVISFFDPELRELDAIQAEVARSRRQPGEGAISDFDARQFMAMGYGRDKPLETNRNLIRAQRVANDATLQRRQFIEWYFGQYGTTDGAVEAWDAYARENPIFDRGSQSRGEPVLNSNRMGWREFFTGQPGGESLAELDLRQSASNGADINPATGLPRQPGLEAIMAGTREDPLRPEEMGQASPGSSADMAIDVTDREALLKAGPGAYVRFPDGTVERLSGAPIVGEATGEQVAPGVFRNTVSPEAKVAQRETAPGIVRNIDAAVRGLADTLTFGFADELAAGANAILPLDQGSSSIWQGKGFGQAYGENVAQQRAIDRADEQNAGAARLTGQVAGALAGGVGAARATPAILRAAPRVAGASRLANAGRVAGNIGRLSAGGAAAGGAYGVGSAEGDLAERAPSGVLGAAYGGVLAPVAAGVGEKVVAPVLGAAGRAVGVLPRRSALESAVNRFGSRYNPNPNALASKVDELEGMGIEPAFVDVMDRGQRGLGRALAMRQTPAREAVAEFAEGRAEALPGRLSYQARRTMSPDPRSPMELREALAAEGRRAAQPLYEEAYAQPFTPSPVINDLIQRPAGQAALQRAARIAANEGRDPMTLGFTLSEDGTQIVGLGRQPSMQTMDYVKRGLDDVLEGYRDKTTGRLALDTEGRAIEGIRKEFVNELDQLNPAYRAARQSYADMSRLQRATELGEGFLTTESDEFARMAEGLTPAERELARAASRRAVERGAGTQGAAPGVAQRLASGREQGIKNRALMGEAAAPMQAAMRAERQMLMNARDINPGAGSPTAQNQMDILETAGNVANVGMSALTGNVRGTLGGLGRLIKLGYSDREAQAIMEAAIDPGQTRKIIDMLSERGLSREKARNLTRALRFYAGQRGGEMGAGVMQ